MGRNGSKVAKKGLKALRKVQKYHEMVKILFNETSQKWLENEPN